MKVYNSILGNMNLSPEWKQKLNDAEIDYIFLDQWTAQKSRFLGKGMSGTEYPIALARHSQIVDGDIIDYDPDTKKAAVIRIELSPVLVINMGGLADKDPQTIIRIAVELGHAIGNQHWPAVVKDTKVYVPLTVDKKVMLSVMETHHIEGITYEFQKGLEIIPFLAPHEIRRLFGGAGQESHSHKHDHGHIVHCHEHFHEHCHDSTFPVGTFSFSNGLETASFEHIVTDAKTLEAFTRSQARQAAFSDGVAAILTHRAFSKGDYEKCRDIDRHLIMFKMNAEARLMITRMGKKLAELAVRLFDSPLISRWLSEIHSEDTPGTYPVAQGMTFATAEISEKELFCSHQYGIVNMVLSAALRCVRVSHYDTQLILEKLSNEVEQLYDEASQMELQDMNAFYPELDILASLHEKGNMRMFMN